MESVGEQTAGSGAETPTPAVLSKDVQQAIGEPIPIDVRVLMKHSMDEISFALSLLDDFEVSSDDFVNRIAVFTNEGQSEAATAAAQALAGITILLGMMPLCEIATEIELAGRAGRIHEMRQLVSVLRFEMNRCVAYLPQGRIDCIQTTVKQRQSCSNTGQNLEAVPEEGDRDR